MLGRLHLIPREQRFFELLSRAAENTLEGAHVLVELLENCEQHDHLARRLQEIEHAGDELTHQMQATSDRTFLTPFDREDISALASSIDDVIDWANLAGRRIRLNHISECTPARTQVRAGHSRTDGTDRRRCPASRSAPPRFRTGAANSRDSPPRERGRRSPGGCHYA